MLNETERKRMTQQAPSQLREATVADPPVAAEGWLRVELDAEPGVIHECPWVRPETGASAPVSGDGAAVIESDAGNYWAVSWWPND